MDLACSSVYRAYFAPESPWNAIGRNKPELIKQSLRRLGGDSPNKGAELEATIAHIRHTTELEKAETEGASLWDCFKGVNLRRTEVVILRATRTEYDRLTVCKNCMTRMCQIWGGDPLTSYAVVFL